jgi:hypothetical protein
VCCPWVRCPRVKSYSCEETLGEMRFFPAHGALVVAENIAIWSRNDRKERAVELLAQNGRRRSKKPEEGPEVVCL